jgi:hypothetical protein
LPEHSAKGKSWCGVAALLPQGFTVHSCPLFWTAAIPCRF